MQTIDVNEEKLKVHEVFKRTPLLLPNGQYMAIAWMKGEYKLHTHNKDEVIFILDGRLSMEVEGKVKKLSPGMAILIKQGERHRSKATRKTLVMLFGPQGITTDFLE